MIICGIGVSGPGLKAVILHGRSGPKVIRNATLDIPRSRRNASQTGTATPRPPNGTTACGLPRHWAEINSDTNQIAQDKLNTLQREGGEGRSASVFKSAHLDEPFYYYANDDNFASLRRTPRMIFSHTSPGAKPCIPSYPETMQSVYS